MLYALVIVAWGWSSETSLNLQSNIIATYYTYDQCVAEKETHGPEGSACIPVQLPGTLPDDRR